MKLMYSKKLQISFYSLLSLLLGITIGLTIYYSVLPLIFDEHVIPRPAYMQVTVDEMVKRPFMKIDNVSYNIRGLAGSLIINTDSLPVNILMSIISFLQWGGIVMGLFLIRKILLNIYSGLFFDKHNTIYTKIIGMMIIGIPFIKFLVQFLIFKIIYEAPFLQKINGFQLDKKPDISFSTLLLGVFVYIFSQIFNEGFRLKQENDLTV